MTKLYIILCDTFTNCVTSCRIMNDKRFRISYNYLFIVKYFERMDVYKIEIDTIMNIDIMNKENGNDCKMKCQEVSSH